MVTKSRKSYSIEFKVGVLNYLKFHSIRETADKFGIARKMVSNWLEQESRFRLMVGTKLAQCRKLHPGRVKASGAKSVHKKRIGRAVFIDMYDVLLNWHKDVDRAFFEIGKTNQLGQKIKWGSLSILWKRLIDEQLDKIRRGLLPFLPLDEIRKETLIQLNQEEDLNLLMEEHKALMDSWENGSLKECTVNIGNVLNQLRGEYVLACVGDATVASVVHLSRCLNLSWDIVLGSEIARQYVPDGQVYYKAADCLRMPIEKCIVISCTPSVVLKAKSIGMSTCFIAPDHSTWTDSEIMDIEANSNSIVTNLQESVQFLLKY